MFNFEILLVNVFFLQTSKMGDTNKFFARAYTVLGDGGMGKNKIFLVGCVLFFVVKTRLAFLSQFLLTLYAEIFPYHNPLCLIQ